MLKRDFCNSLIKNGIVKELDVINHNYTSSRNKTFEIDKILLVTHGGWHKDTICVVEHKI